MIVVGGDSPETGALAVRAAVLAQIEYERITSLPRRLTAAVALVSRSIVESCPEALLLVGDAVSGSSIVASAGSARDRQPGSGRRRMLLVHKLVIGDETYYPDNAFATDLHAICELFAEDGRSQLPGAPGGDPPFRASAAFAGAVAAGMTLIGPSRVVGLIRSPAEVSEWTENDALEVGRVANALAAQIRATARQSGGPPAAEETRVVAESVAGALRLTSTQRARLIRCATSAAIRSGTVPAPLTSMPVAAPSKAANKERFRTLIAELEEWLRVRA